MAGELAEEVTAALGVSVLARAGVAYGVRFIACRTHRTHTFLPCDAGSGNALTIGRVDQHHTGRVAWGHALQGITAAKLDTVCDTSPLGISLCKIDHAVGYITAEDQTWNRLLDTLGLRLNCAPDVRLERQHLLERKSAQ